MYSQDKISTVYDEYIAEYWEQKPRWEIILNNNLKVYQDDGRPGTEISAWERLRNYCYKNNLFITDMKIAFRTNTKSLPSNKNGYFFKRMARAYFGSNICKEHFIVGYEENDAIKIEIYTLPELLLDTFESRPIIEEDISLIRKPLKVN